MIPPDVLPILMPVILAFDALGIPYQIGGSLASSAWGKPRSTQDADLVADVQPQHVAPLVACLESQYYIDDEMIRDAIRHHSSFNMLHLDTMYKVDVFMRKPTAFDTLTFQRARREWIDDPPQTQAMLTSPEDIVLHKLVWYQMGGEVSERQWLDILNVLKVQGPALDQIYLQTWAAQLGVAALLADAQQTAEAE
jgi:hypothetical protein